MNVLAAQHKARGLTLIELVAVATLGALLAWGAIHSLTTISQEEATIRRLSLSPSRNDYAILTTVLDDRLSKAWGYQAVTQTNAIVRGVPQYSWLWLLNSDGRTNAELTMTVKANVLTYAILDFDGNGTITNTWTYAYTNQGEPSAFLITINTNQIVHWSIPPPFYVNAETNAFVPIFPGQDVSNRLSQLRAANSAMLQRECRQYNFSPTWSGYR